MESVVLVQERIPEIVLEFNMVFPETVVLPEIVAFWFTLNPLATEIPPDMVTHVSEVLVNTTVENVAEPEQ